eukprot:Opistho-2@62614
MSKGRSKEPPAAAGPQVFGSDDEEEDDMYSGYNDTTGYEYNDFTFDEGFQQALKTSYGQRGVVPATAAPQTAMRRQNVPGTASMGGRLQTGVAPQSESQRPMTSVRAAGYTSHGGRSAGGSFDPMNQGGRGPAPPLEVKSEDSPEEVIKQFEKKVNLLLEESAIAHAGGDFKTALERAKEAGRSERFLSKQREQNGLGDQNNLDLTYSVLFNLANQYHASEMHQEALNTYSVIVKNKMFTNAGRLRVNMGNIYFEQKNYPSSIKMYRMALDQMSSAHKEMRFKIMQNIGHAFVQMGQYHEAITSYEGIMDGSPDLNTGLNLILCYYALGDRDRMRKGFAKLLTVRQGVEDEDRYYASEDSAIAVVNETLRDDTLAKMEREKRKTAEKCIMIAAKLIAASIDVSFAAGYDWCVEQVKSSAYSELASELEITKAITFLKMKDFKQAIDSLKKFEKKDTKMMSTAATNLSFLYFLENDLKHAEKYADQAIHADRYNASALVNKGNCFFCNGRL